MEAAMTEQEAIHLINGCDDNLEVVKQYASFIKEAGDIQASLRVHEQVKQRLITAMSSPEYTEYIKKHNNLRELDSYAKQIKLPGES